VEDKAKNSSGVDGDEDSNGSVDEAPLDEV
jgi:hypothetical protein